MSFFGELRRRNVFKVAIAYAIVGWLLIEVSTTVLPLFEAPGWIAQVFAFFVILGFPLALVLSWAYELTPEGIKLERDVAARESITHATGRKIDFAIIGALVLALGFVVNNYVLVNSDDEATVAEVVDEPPAVVDENAPEVLPNSVAVLLFDNLSPDPDDAYFAAGLHDEILSQLAKLSALSVISRTSVLRYSDSDLSIPEIARELNVGTVMEGSVRYANGRVRITTQLIDAGTDEHLWSETYEREFSDIFAIESDIAMNIANALEAEFSLEEQASIEEVPTDSAEAYESFLRAAQVGTGPSGVQLRLAYLDQAIDADPEFARALAYRSFYRSSSLTLEIGTQENYSTRRAELEALALDDIDRALSLDPTLGLAYGARAFIHSRNWRGRDALEAYERAIELTPYDPDLASVYTLFLSNIGQHEDAIRIAQRFLELDPNNAVSHGNLGRALLWAGDFEGANAAHRESLRINPNAYNIHWRLCLGLILSGDQTEAEAQLRLLEISVYSANPVLITNVAYGFSRLGLQDDATDVLNRFEEVVAGRRMPALAWMNVSLAKGEEGQALEWLRQAAEGKEPYEGHQLALDIRVNLFQEPALDRPEFAELREQLGYTDL